MAIALGGGGTLALTAMQLITPLAGAAAIVTFPAPYTAGTAIQHRDPAVQGCAASLTVTRAAAFSLAYGTRTGQVAPPAGPCASSDPQSTLA